MPTPEPREQPTAASAIAVAGTSPVLEVAGLRFRYPGAQGGAGGDVLTIPALTLGEGEQMLLTGRSGSGKSTLLHLIAGLLEPTGGTVRVAGRQVHKLGGAQRDLFRGRTIGMIFQTFNLLPGFSAMENVMLAMMLAGAGRKEQHERAGSLLASLGIQRPEADVATLSVGQQQRVAVARAVACSPALVLADEPTASLDPDSADEAMGVIQQACGASGAALLCVSHDPGMRRRFSRVAALEDLNRAADGGGAGGTGGNRP